jgi:hypothetical protein
MSWEYKDYVYTYQPGWSWCKTGGFNGYTYASARITFWQESQKYILPELQKWRDEGWEPIGEVGPSGISLRSYRSYGKSVGERLFVLVVGMMTCGLFFLIGGWSWYVEPEKFSVQMRRGK